MNCIGIFIDPETAQILINPDLIISHGSALIECNGHRTSPEMLRQVVQRGLRKIQPNLIVKFWDADEQQEPEGNFGLLVNHGLTVFSRSMH
jgi:hypothetical protein